MRVKGTIYNTKPDSIISYYVSDYLKEMYRIYTEKYKGERATLEEQRETEKNRWKTEQARGWNDFKQKLSDKQRHDEIMESIRKEIKNLKETASAELDQILIEADERFEKRSRPTAETVDLAAVKLIESGSLSVSELSRLTDDYADNLAMSRIIAKYAREKANQSGGNREEWEKVAVKTLQAEFDYRSPLESWKENTLNALNDYMIKAKAWDRVMAESYKERLSECENMFVSEVWQG